MANKLKQIFPMTYRENFGIHGIPLISVIKLQQQVIYKRWTLEVANLGRALLLPLFWKHFCLKYSPFKKKLVGLLDHHLHVREPAEHQHLKCIPYENY